MKYIFIILLFCSSLSFCNPALNGLYTDRNKLVEVENTERIPFVSDTLWGNGYDAVADLTGYRVYQLGRNGDDNFRFVQGTPLQHWTENAGHLSFGSTFATLYKDSIAEKVDAIIVIPCGRGGVGFTGNLFDKGGQIYEDCLTRLNYIKSIYPTATLEVFLWHQGEADVNNPNYSTKFEAMVDNMRIDYDMVGVPFIVGGMQPLWVKADSARIVQQERLEDWQYTLDDVGYMDPTLPDTIRDVNSATDTVHYNAVGHREMAERYFQEYKLMIEE